MMMSPGSRNAPLPSFLQPGVISPLQSSTSLPQSHQVSSATPVPDLQPRSQPQGSKSLAPQVYPPPQNLSSSGSSATQPRVSPSALPAVQSSSQPVFKRVSRKPVNREHENLVSGEASESVGIGLAMLVGTSEDGTEDSTSESSASRDVSQTSLEAHDAKQVETQVVVSKPSSIEPSLLSPPLPHDPQSNGAQVIEQDRLQSSSQSSTNCSPNPTSSDVSDENAAVYTFIPHAGQKPGTTPKTPIAHSTLRKRPNAGQGTSAAAPQSTRGSLDLRYPEESGSVHHSISTFSSSQSNSSTSPRPRHIPKHLVMPAPLSQQGMTSRPRYHTMHSRTSNYFSPQQIPLLGVEPSYRPSTFPERMGPTNTVVKVQTGGIQFSSAKVAKLKKRVSMITPTSPSSPPIITTVSFVPPIIDFNGPVANANGLQHAMMNNLAHKRVLSKRRAVS